jgi:type II secretory ATPase GspE/PulE/Tfp pilus assembly ATPase PilB-like protein
VPIPGSDFLKATGIKPEWLEAATTLLRGTGCPKCQGKGYIGRKAIFEALIVDQEIERAIAQKKSPRGFSVNSAFQRASSRVASSAKSGASMERESLSWAPNF